MDTNSTGESGTFNGKKICFSVADVLDRLLERQFLLSPWVREKRLRNQLRLVLKVINDRSYHVLLYSLSIFRTIWKLAL